MALWKSDANGRLCLMGPLPIAHAPVTLQLWLALQVDRPTTTAAYAQSNDVFWRGYWWCGELRKTAAGTGVYVKAACPAGMAAIVSSTPERLTYRVKVGATRHGKVGHFAPRLTLNIPAYRRQTTR